MDASDQYPQLKLFNLLLLFRFCPWFFFSIRPAVPVPLRILLSSLGSVFVYHEAIMAFFFSSQGHDLIASAARSPQRHLQHSAALPVRGGHSRKLSSNLQLTLEWAVLGRVGHSKRLLSVGQIAGQVIVASHCLSWTSGRSFAGGRPVASVQTSAFTAADGQTEAPDNRGVSCHQH